MHANSCFLCNNVSNTYNQKLFRGEEPLFRQSCMHATSIIMHSFVTNVSNTSEQKPVCISERVLPISTDQNLACCSELTFENCSLIQSTKIPTKLLDLSLGDSSEISTTSKRGIYYNFHFHSLPIPM
jgi:hypothetical protein